MTLSDVILVLIFKIYCKFEAHVVIIFYFNPNCLTDFSQLVPFLCIKKMSRKFLIFIFLYFFNFQRQIWCTFFINNKMTLKYVLFSLPQCSTYNENFHVNREIFTWANSRQLKNFFLTMTQKFSCILMICQVIISTISQLDFQ